MNGPRESRPPSDRLSLVARAGRRWAGASSRANRPGAPVQVGFFEPPARESLLQERPNLKFIVLESGRPLRVRLDDPSRNKSYDLTPLIPAWVIQDSLPPPEENLNEDE